METTTRSKTRIGSIAAIAAIAAIALTGCSGVDSLINSLTGGESRGEDGAILKGGNTDVFTLRVGDCIATSAGEGEVEKVPTVPCTQPHDDEVYFDFNLDGGDYPGDNAIFERADQRCYEAFTNFVGISLEESKLDFSYYYPTIQSWAQGDRLVSCLVFDPAGQTTGTLAGSKR